MELCTTHATLEYVGHFENFISIWESDEDVQKKRIYSQNGCIHFAFSVEISFRRCS